MGILLFAQILAFPGLDKLEKVAHRSLTALKMKSDVTISKAQLIQDANILIDYHSRVSFDCDIFFYIQISFSQTYPCILLPFPFLSFSYITNRNLNSLPFPSFPSPSHPFSLYFLHFSFANSPIDFFPRQLDIIGKKIKRSLPFSLFPFFSTIIIPFSLSFSLLFFSLDFLPRQLDVIGKKISLPYSFSIDLFKPSLPSIFSITFNFFPLLFPFFLFPSLLLFPPPFPLLLNFIRPGNLVRIKVEVY